MNTSCALCTIPLTPMDTVLGENKLSDGGILCNKCLNKATAVNNDLVNSLINYSLTEIRDLVWSESVEEAEEVVEEPVVETRVSRTTMTFSHTVRFTIDKPKPSKKSEEIKEQDLASEAIESDIHTPEKKVRQNLVNPVSLQKEDPSTVFDKLEKLGRLRENGILTEEEFAEQKKKLLNKL